MALQAALVLGYGIEHSGHPVGYIVAYNEAHEQQRYEHTYGRPKKEEPVAMRGGDM